MSRIRTRRQGRRTAAIVSGIIALAAVSLAVLAPPGSVAVAAQTPPGPDAAPTKIEAMCLRLPGLQASTADGLALNATTLTSANDAMAARRAAMTVAMTGLADAVGGHLAALDAGADPGPTGATLKARQMEYVTAVVDWSRSRTQAFDAERQRVFGELQQTLLESLDESACP